MTMQTHNLKDIGVDQFTKIAYIEEIPTRNLHDMVEVFNKKLTSALDHQAPEKNPKEYQNGQQHLGSLMR